MRRIRVGTRASFIRQQCQTRLFLVFICLIYCQAFATQCFVSAAVPAFIFGVQEKYSVGSKSLPTNENLEAASLLYQEHENLLVRRGALEEKLMAAAMSIPLVAPVIKGMGATGGFGASTSKKNSKRATSSASSNAEGNKPSRASAQVGRALGKVLRKEGVVRMDNVIPTNEIISLRNFVTALREESSALVAAGTVLSTDRFADVLLTHNRCDLKIPLGSVQVADALASALLDSPIGQTIKSILGPQAILYELSCLISDPGSQRQVTHPDTPHQESHVLLTSFIALQDVRNLSECPVLNRNIVFLSRN
jgi:hypothetical protein